MIKFFRGLKSKNNKKIKKKVSEEREKEEVIDTFNKFMQNALKQDNDIVVGMYYTVQSIRTILYVKYHASILYAHTCTYFNYL